MALWKDERRLENSDIHGIQGTNTWGFIILVYCSLYLYVWKYLQQFFPKMISFTRGIIGNSMLNKCFIKYILLFDPSCGKFSWVITFLFRHRHTYVPYQLLFHVTCIFVNTMHQMLPKGVGFWNNLIKQNIHNSTLKIYQY